MVNIDFSRQTEIFNPANQSYHIAVFGVGSLGSFITLTLAKLGFSHIDVYDYDVVEAGNIPNQFYRTTDIGKHKVVALKEMVKQFTNVDINIHITKVDKYSPIECGLDTIFILTFDNLKQRKIIFDRFRDYPNYLIDARMGGEEFKIITTKLCDSDDLVMHDKEFDIVETQLKCGMKSVIYSVLAISSEVCNIVKKINNGQKYPKLLNRHMSRNFFLTDLK
jgi:hypothetical protein